MPSMFLNSLKCRQAALRILAACVLTASHAPAADSIAYFTYLKSGSGGGVGRAFLDPAGQLRVEQMPKASGEHLDAPFKLAVSGNFLAVAVGEDREPGIELFDLEGAAPSKHIPMPAEISDLAAVPDGFVAGMSKGLFARIDATSASITATCNARKSLDPPGRKAEFLLPLPSKNLLLSSFQKDDNNSPALGNRVEVFEMDSLTPLADLPLPRDRPVLHLSKSEAGPGPETLAAFPDSNCLAISLDLYGAIAWADLDAALSGKWENFTSTSTAPDEAWGTAFPDRLTAFQIEQKDYLLVGNAGNNAGMVLFDVANRKRVASFFTRSGTDQAILFPDKYLAATVASGKIKSRGAKRLEKESQPESELLLLDLEPLTKAAAPTLRRISLPLPTLRICAFSPDSVLVFSEKELLQIEIPSGNILQRATAPGTVVRAVGR